jgi:micrococcal nuclease
MGGRAFKGRRGSVALFFVAAAILLRPWSWEHDGTATEASRRLTGLVVRAVDGDTLEVAVDGGATETARLIGVDTPETVKPDTPVQCFGPRASAFEHEHVEGRRVRLLVGVEPRDIYGRLLAYVWIREPGRDRFLEEALLRRGLARTLTFHPNDRFAHRFEGLEQKAAAAGKGLWNAC